MLTQRIYKYKESLSLSEIVPYKQIAHPYTHFQVAFGLYITLPALLGVGWGTLPVQCLPLAAGRNVVADRKAAPGGDQGSQLV